MTATQAVRDNPQQQRFEIDVDGRIAVANYRIDGDVITFTHTEVPESLQNRGLGTKLVEAGLDAARSRGLTVVPQCGMFAQYMKRHPETLELTAAGRG